MSAITSSGGNSTTVGVLMAFNTIGAQFLDLVDLAIDTLAGGNVVGTSAPTETTAYIHDSSLGTVAHPIGALSVTANSTEFDQRDGRQFHFCRRAAVRQQQ